jgi:predicted metal-binding protein
MEKYNFNPDILKSCFNLKVREMCKSCKRYGQKATCPPYVENVEYYHSLLPSYKQGILLVSKFKIDNIKNWKILGKNSSLEIHKELLKIRTELFNNGHGSVIFGAGSCKNCEKCQFPCRFPSKSVIPLEATGLDVIQLVNKITKIIIKFPVEKQKYFYRIGAVFYD